MTFLTFLENWQLLIVRLWTNGAIMDIELEYNPKLSWNMQLSNVMEPIQC